MSPKPLARLRADGGTTYQVKWRLGGTRAGAWASESFTDERAAKRFCLDVEDAAMQWPDGWLKGVGYATEDDTPAPPRLRDVAESYWGQQERRVRRGKVKPYTLQRDRRTVELHMATLLDRDFTEIDDDDVADWIDDQLDAGVAPKSVRNRHGLLSSIVTHGAGRMKLRPDNPCALSDLPEANARGRRQIRFFLHAEWALVRACLRDDVHLLVDTLLATGMRWGEVTALRVGDCQVQEGGQVILHVQRAWSQRAKDDPAPVDTAADETRAWVLGPPKGGKVRFVAADGPTATALAAAIAGRDAAEYVFRTRGGIPWRYPEFHENRWKLAADDALARGLSKQPTIHMLRHTFVVWALHDGAPIHIISEALGHSSIQITMDVYGGLVNLHDPTAARSMARQMLAVLTNLEQVPTPAEVTARPGRRASKRPTLTVESS